ncbi:MAG: sulfatase [Pirellulales bacterium]
MRHLFLDRRAAGRPPRIAWRAGLLSMLTSLLTAFAGVEAAEKAHESDAAARKPNVLWFIVDDMSANFSCYGEPTISTPNVDRLAREGTRFRHAFVTAPVCSACRSALITGMYQTSIGAHQHRSGRGTEKIQLPAGVEPIPGLMQRAGYYTCIGDGLIAAPTAASPGGRSAKPRKARLGKTDYNFEWDASIYDGDDWSGRAAGQPFFMQVQLPGGKLRLETTESAERLAKKALDELGSATSVDKVELPPYYPRVRELLVDWAAYLDAVRFTDKHVGDVLARLEREGVLEETLVIFMTDHGISHARGKQFLYDEGVHVPLVIHGPGVGKGVERTDLVEHIDLAAVTLSAAGIPLPAKMQGRDILASDYRPRDAVFAARDRCDETVDRLRSVRTDRFLYIRNFHPQRPLLQPNAYKDGKTILQTLRRLHAAGSLPTLSEQLLFAPSRPAEELYEWPVDRWQVHNLAHDEAHRATLEQLRSRLDRWIVETGDRGPEGPRGYESEMEVYLNDIRRRSPEQAGIIERNMAVMKKWASEGK